MNIFRYVGDGNFLFERDHNVAMFVSVAFLLQVCAQLREYAHMLGVNRYLRLHTFKYSLAPYN